MDRQPCAQGSACSGGVSGRFALQPEISYLRAFTGSDTSWLSGELSFVVGEVP